MEPNSINCFSILISENLNLITDFHSEQKLEKLKTKGKVTNFTH